MKKGETYTLDVIRASEVESAFIEIFNLLRPILVIEEHGQRYNEIMSNLIKKIEGLQSCNNIKLGGKND